MVKRRAYARQKQKQLETKQETAKDSLVAAISSSSETLAKILKKTSTSIASGVSSGGFQIFSSIIAAKQAYNTYKETYIKNENDLSNIILEELQNKYNFQTPGVVEFLTKQIIFKLTDDLCNEKGILDRNNIHSYKDFKHQITQAITNLGDEIERVRNVVRQLKTTESRSFDLLRKAASSNTKFDMLRVGDIVETCLSKANTSFGLRQMQTLIKTEDDISVGIFLDLVNDLFTDDRLASLHFTNRVGDKEYVEDLTAKIMARTGMVFPETVIAYAEQKGMVLSQQQENKARDVFHAIAQEESLFNRENKAVIVTNNSYERFSDIVNNHLHAFIYELSPEQLKILRSSFFNAFGFVDNETLSEEFVTCLKRENYVSSDGRWKSLPEFHDIYRISRHLGYSNAQREEIVNFMPKEVTYAKSRISSRKRNEIILAGVAISFEAFAGLALILAMLSTINLFFMAESFFLIAAAGCLTVGSGLAFTRYEQKNTKICNKLQSAMKFERDIQNLHKSEKKELEKYGVSYNNLLSRAAFDVAKNTEEKAGNLYKLRAAGSFAVASISSSFLLLAIIVFDAVLFGGITILAFAYTSYNIYKSTDHEDHCKVLDKAYHALDEKGHIESKLVLSKDRDEKTELREEIKYREDFIEQTYKRYGKFYQNQREVAPETCYKVDFNRQRQILSR